MRYANYTSYVILILGLSYLGLILFDNSYSKLSHTIFIGAILASYVAHFMIKKKDRRVLTVLNSILLLFLFYYVIFIRMQKEGLSLFE